MKLQIEIPKEFEEDFNKDKFNECFERVITDIISNKNKTGTYELAGNYEIETLKMLKEALNKADKIIIW